MFVIGLTTAKHELKFTFIWTGPNISKYDTSIALNWNTFAHLKTKYQTLNDCSWVCNPGILKICKSILESVKAALR
jgi:hypothetical protein